MSFLCWFAVCAALLLAGCGGKSLPSVPENSARITESGYSLQISLLRESSAQLTSTISSADPGRVFVSLTHYGEALPSQIVTFSSTLGAFVPNLGTVLTNSSGEAAIRLIPAGIEGAGTITASVYIDDLGASLSIDLNFVVTDATDSDTSVSGVNLALSFVPSDVSTNAIRGDAPGSVMAMVTDENGAVMANTLVTFSATNMTLAPSTGQVLTNASGVATVTVLANDVVGVGTLTALVVQNEVDYSESINITIESPSIKLGYYDGSMFSDGELNISTNLLSAGGSASITASIVDGSDVLYAEALDVSFTSTCVLAGTATVDATATSTSGVVTAIYRANGCVGSDTITATLSFAGAVFTASAQINVASDVVGSIEFVNASLQTIVIRGVGGQGLLESSVVSFRVRGVLGGPLANQEVAFSLTSTVGGLRLTPETATSNSEGLVYTTVNSGSVPTTIAVIAQAFEAGVTTQSDMLVVSTGVAVQKNTSISVRLSNPEALDRDDETVEVTVQAADQFNNPIPDGISFLFTAESGGIEPSCVSVSGQCTVTWTSLGDRPMNGRASIMVTTIGAESFDDENANGVFDDGDVLDGYDLDEAFLDKNENGMRDVGEPYSDFNNNGIWDLADGLYGGPSCLDSSRCASQSGATVRQSLVIVTSGSNANFSFSPNEGTIFSSGDSLTITLSDDLGNSLPGDSLIEVSLEFGELKGGAASYVIPTTRLAPTSLSFFVSRAGTEPTDLLSVKVTTPNGIVTYDTYQIIYGP